MKTKTKRIIRMRRKNRPEGRKYFRPLIKRINRAIFIMMDDEFGRPVSL